MMCRVGKGEICIQRRKKKVGLYFVCNQIYFCERICDNCMPMLLNAFFFLMFPYFHEDYKWFLLRQPYVCGSHAVVSCFRTINFFVFNFNYSRVVMCYQMPTLHGIP